LTQRMWMVRGAGGRLYETFREQSLVAIGWAALAPEAKAGMPKNALASLYTDRYSQDKQRAAITGVSQVWRFLNEIAVGDLVTTYSPANRTYLVGVVHGAAECRAKRADDELAFVRPVKWRPIEIDRDRLGAATKNGLGSVLTVFVVPAFAASGMVSAAEQQARSEPVRPVDPARTGNGETPRL
jgi:restriction system protein